MKVCVVIPYFGRWPQLLPLFLESCRRNPKLDVLIVTDNDPPEGAPDNVRFITTGFGKIRDRFSRSLGFGVALPNPYKLCDFKPAYGFLFQEELRGYDFWGHGDLDLVYSDLSEILDPDFLTRYDVISFREEWIWGPFTLYRNVPEINELFRNSPDHEMVLRSNRHLAFDESSLQWSEMASTPVYDIHFAYENMTLIVKRAAREGLIRAYFESREVVEISEGGFARFDSGRVTYQGKEVLFLHWGSYTHLGKLSLARWRDAPQSFYLTPYRFCTDRQFNSPFFRWIEFAHAMRYRGRRLVAPLRRVLMSLRDRLLPLSDLARRIRDVPDRVVEAVRLQLNLQLLLRLPADLYEAIPDSLKDGLAHVLQQHRRQGDLFFVQIGANDGVRNDPIHKYVMRDRWEGVVVEPAPSIFADLIANRRRNRKIGFENVAIAEQSGSQSFYSLRSSATDGPGRDNRGGSLCREAVRGGPGSLAEVDDLIVEEKVRTISYSHLMEKYGEPRVNLLHIDTQGWDARILQSIDFERHGPQSIFCEYLNESERVACSDLLRSTGYQLIFRETAVFAYRRSSPSVPS